MIGVCPPAVHTPEQASDRAKRVPSRLLSVCDVMHIELRRHVPLLTLPSVTSANFFENLKESTSGPPYTAAPLHRDDYADKLWRNTSKEDPMASDPQQASAEEQATGLLVAKLAGKSIYLGDLLFPPQQLRRTGSSSTLGTIRETTTAAS